MNIALIVRKYQTSGGTERFNYNLSKYLAQKGHHVNIFCEKYKIEPPNKNIKIVKVFTLPLNRTVKTLTFSYSIYKKNFSNFDIVQGCGKIIKQDIYRAGGGFHKLYLKMSGKEVSTLYDKFIISLEKKIYNIENTKFVIAVSNFIKKNIVEEFNYPEERIRIFHNPVDLNIFNSKNINFKNNKELKFLFVANNFKLKGLESILTVLKYFDNFTLFVVGSDNINKFLSKIPEKLKSKILFLGEKKGEDLINLYKEADVLIHPTYFDPFANVCLEAMACGTPVITTKINGASEIIENYQDGIIIDHADNILQLKEAVENIFSNKELLLNMKKNCLKKIKLYSIDRYVDRLLEFYREVKKVKNCSNNYSSL